MFTRSQVFTALVASTIVLSGCTAVVQDSETFALPISELDSSSISHMTDSEYQEALDRIRADEKLAAELLERIEEAEKRQQDVGVQRSNTSDHDSSKDSVDAPAGSVPSNDSTKQGSKDTVVSNAIKATPYAEAAYAKIITFADGSAIVGDDLVVAAPNLPDFHIENLKSVTAKSMSMFDEQYDLPKGYQIIAFTDRDFEWADKKLIEYGGQHPDGTWTNAFAKSDQGKDHCWMAVASSERTQFCMAINPVLAQQQINTIAHEYFHVVQLGPIGIKPLTTPVWITEGGAEYFGWVIVNRGSAYTLKTLANQETRFLNKKFPGSSGYKDYLKYMSEDEFIAAMQSLEGGSLDASAREAHNRFDMYKLGAAANEYLVGKYSYDVYMGFLESIGRGGVHWSTAFVSAFGITHSEFYSDLYDYLVDAIIQ